MSAVRIRKRKRTGRYGKPYTAHTVAYRRGGRSFPEEYAGTFKSDRDARTRAAIVGGWLAQGLDPQAMLAELASPARVETIAELAPAYFASRVDWSDASRKTIEGYFRNHLLPTFGHLAPAEVTTKLVQEWINGRVEAGAAPAPVRGQQSALAGLLDYCEIDPNPARGRKLRQPVVEETWTVPPSNLHVLAMLDHLDRRTLLAVAVLETTGVRISEMLGWEHGDVDATDPTDPRILSRPEVTKGRRQTAGNRRSRRPRWVQVPAWLYRQMAATWPHHAERDPSGRLFPDLTASMVRHAMAEACKAAGVPHYHPHDLRHRRISLWHAQGIPARAIGDRVGQKLISTTLDTYTHTMPTAEVTEAEWRKVLVR